MTVTSPNEELCIIDSKYVNEKESLYYLKFDYIPRTEYLLQDSNHNDIFKITYSGLCTYDTIFKDIKSGQELYKCERKEHLTKSNEFKIKDIEKDETIFEAKISKKNSLTHYKYLVTFTNKVTGKDESLEFVFSFSGQECKVYYGEKKKEGKLICQSSNISKTAYENKIEIASNVDTMFMLIIYNEIVHSHYLENATMQGVALASTISIMS
ncbi:hypothetical protein BCR32DRAFT_326008 [Anaeromyces robustus]|uniref:Uncharacterized protein n=1 Tax=Anaeromyces robustus TaxID=1754192 RepID=A0A1Y1XET7_9FUNG|nr:hypothetical protein BCR32DRAFT_326008 [Anaeromyces robustus]|eukprot:ORX84280.1 hypothetical protein BCR32DRAFT_326008 [Anaeromyces robustus]